MSEIDWEIRPYEAGDEAAVNALLQEVFDTDAEARLVRKLRADGDAVIELVADSEGMVLGYLMMSSMSRPDKTLGLGPVATATDKQRLGIASSLIESGLALALVNDQTAVFLLGEPSFYERFGFEAEAASKFQSPYAGPHFMMAVLDDDEAPRGGEAVYAPAFAMFED
jgi:putative acetyltransferase